MGHLWVYHNFDVEIFEIHPRGEEISRSVNFRFRTMIEFDYLSHHIGTTIYLLGLYVEKWVQSLQWTISRYRHERSTSWDVLRYITVYMLYLPTYPKPIHLNKFKWT